MLKNTQVDYKFRLYLVKCFQYDQTTWTTNIFVIFTMGVNNRSILVYTIQNLHVQYIHENEMQNIREFIRNDHVTCTL
jgi:hypothetical protein